MMLDLASPQRLYIVGIKGVGMTALAQLLAARGHAVSGSDVAETFFTDGVLREHSLQVKEGFSEANVPRDIDGVIYSTAYTLDHPELRVARERGVPLFTYPEVLGALMRTSEAISVAGSHGKTTTTALLGAALATAGRDPSVIVGSYVPEFHGNARLGSSSLLVVETDEYQNKFTHYEPQHLLLTNIDFDHPDFFPSPAAYAAVFEAFVKRIPKSGVLVANADDPESRRILNQLHHRVILFGTSPRAHVRLLDSTWSDGHQTFMVSVHGVRESFRLPLPGTHNALNACAVLAFCSAFHVPIEAVRRALASFGGIKRRFEILGEVDQALFIDDYAHHPAEIAAAIAGARSRYPHRRLLVVFQPHTYSRTKTLLNDFARALTGDLTVVLEVYGSAREKTATVSSRDLVSAVPAEGNAIFAATLSDAATTIRDALRPNDVVLLMGAGDVWRVKERVEGKR